MRLIVLCSGHGKTQKNRLGFGETGPTAGLPNGGHSGIADGASGPVAWFGANDLEGGRQGDWRWPGNRGSAPDKISTPQGERSAHTTALGRAAAGADEAARGAGLSDGLEAQSRARPIGRGDAAAGGAGGKTRAPRKAIGSVSLAGSPPLAQSCPRHPTSQSRVSRPGGMEKKRSPRSWRPC